MLRLPNKLFIPSDSLCDAALTGRGRKPRNVGQASRHG